MKKTSILLCSALLFTSNYVQAEESSISKFFKNAVAPQEQVSFTGAYIGGTYTMSHQYLNAEVNGGGQKMNFEDNDIAHMGGYVIGGGYQFTNPYLRNLYVGAEFAGSHAIGKASMFNKEVTTKEMDISIGMMNDINGLFGYVVNVTNKFALMPYGSVGASFIGVGKNAHDTSSYVGTKFGAGVSALYDRYMLRVGYEYAAYGKGYGAEFGDVVTDSANSYELYTHNVKVTLGYKFF